MMSQRVFAWRNAIRGAARASNPGAARCVSPGASPARCVGGGGGRHVGTSRASNVRAPWTAIVSPQSQRSHRRGACASAGAARGDAAERITSTDNATVKHFAKLVKNRAHRAQSGSVVVAGASLLEEIYGAPDGANLPEVKAMFLADDAPVPRGVPARRVVRAPEHVLKKAAGLRTVDRVDAVAELAAPNLDGAAALGTTDATRVLALDGIQDPGNLGTLVRTALALGWDAVALLPGTCDPFNDKARPLRFPVSSSPRTRARTARFSRLLPMTSSPKSHEHCHAARLGSRPVAPRSSSSFRVLDESQPPRPSLSALRARDAERAGRGGHLSPAPTTSFGPKHHATTWFRPKHHFTTWFRPTIMSALTRNPYPRPSSPSLSRRRFARRAAECSDFPWRVSRGPSSRRRRTNVVCVDSAPSPPRRTRWTPRRRADGWAAAAKATTSGCVSCSDPRDRVCPPTRSESVARWRSRCPARWRASTSASRGGYSCISCDDDDRTFGDEKRGTRNERRGTGRFGSRRGTSTGTGRYESFGEF